MTQSNRRYWGLLMPGPADFVTGIARQAEAQSLAGVFAPQVNSVPWIPLAAAAVATERIQIASGIAIAAARSPFETAMAAIDLDRLSNGRFLLGLGASVQSWTCGVYGAPPHKPLAHLRETVAAVRHIVRGAHIGLDPFEGFLLGKRYLLMDRDGKFCPVFRNILQDESVESLLLPPRSPDLNAYVERFMRSLKSESLSRMIFFGETSLRRAVAAYLDHYHAERNHQGLGNRIIEPPRCTGRSGRPSR